MPWLQLKELYMYRLWYSQGQNYVHSTIKFYWQFQVFFWLFPQSFGLFSMLCQCVRAILQNVIIFPLGGGLLCGFTKERQQCFGIWGNVMSPARVLSLYTLIWIWDETDVDGGVLYWSMRAPAMTKRPTWLDGSIGWQYKCSFFIFTTALNGMKPGIGQCAVK